MSQSNKWKKYTEEDLEYIAEHFGNTTVKGIANHLGRTPKAICDKAYKMGLGRQEDNSVGIPITTLPDILGVSLSTVQYRWIHKRGLKCKKVHGHLRTVKESDLVHFMQEHPNLWDARKCDYWTFQKYPWFLKQLEEDRANDGRNHFRWWTEYEDNQLLLMRKRGMSYRKIGEKLNRNHTSCRLRWNKLNGVIK